ncbi:P-loop containing nucleoside triphosphate hydrolase protein [Flammula alnicola]|nr:P-loop containing nucleoside triphosphate hydrolase protein [Flammula alnicola]
MHDATATIASGSSKRTSSKTAQSNNAGALISSPHYPEIIRQLRSIFMLSEFRTNQLEAVTAALEGKDVFVLMPTGGGKSLCYQLPAICSTGKTKGVTIVVSPLLALMKDQVESLTNKNIDALLSNSETVGDWQRLVVGNRKPSLWYLTPEKLRDNPKIDQILSKLYQGENLARFVIDEAHCISTWGQDFRDAYTALGSLRDKYPSVPIMALTATANQRTVADIITQLKLRPDRASFTQSFNRTNLNYIVRVKKGTPINEMVTFINTNHKGQAGVIYCTARHTCESVANTLRERGVNAAHFHAGMATAEKDQTVRDWQSGTVPVIVATIAFGMGIDKADVRYVIHYDMPKSLSGYYQETGRAGRDGKPADCLMFYSGSDLHKLRNQIRKTEGATEESMKRQETAVEEVFQFCRKTSVCRRVQILRHFDEDFDKKDCAENCDTCKNPSNTVPRDVTVHVRDIITLVRRLVHDDGEKVTFAQIGAILRGSNTAEVRKKQFNQLLEYGSCSTLSKDLLELIFDELLFLKLITKVATKNASGFHTEYLDVRHCSFHYSRSLTSLLSFSSARLPTHSWTRIKQ